MNGLKTVTRMIGIVLLSACGADSENSVPQIQSKADIGSFNIDIAGVHQFDHTGTRANSFIYKDDFWEFESGGAKLRMAGRFPDESSDVEQTSTDLEYNNLYLEFYYKVADKRTRISCKAAQEPKGHIKRTIHQNLSSSGSFSIELVLCRNTYTSEEIAEIETPTVVKGTFEKAPYKESLF